MGVRYKNHIKDPDNWDYVDYYYDTTNTNTNFLEKRFFSEIGKKFDKIGSFGIRIPFLKFNPNKWHSSEFINYLIFDYREHLITPQMLFLKMSFKIN